MHIDESRRSWDKSSEDMFELREGKAALTVTSAPYCKPINYSILASTNGTEWYLTHKMALEVMKHTYILGDMFQQCSSTLLGGRWPILRLFFEAVDQLRIRVVG